MTVESKMQPAASEDAEDGSKSDVQKIAQGAVETLRQTYQIVLHNLQKQVSNIKKLTF